MVPEFIRYHLNFSIMLHRLKFIVQPLLLLLLPHHLIPFSCSIDSVENAIRFASSIDFFADR
jgi:hypothetical protein